MRLARNKKGIEITTLIEIILVVIATGLIIFVFNYAFSRTDDATSENLCRGFNAIRFGTKFDKGPATFNVAPRACKTIDKGNVPGKDYKDYAGGLKEGAKAQLRDMIARCWWMWLEGKQPNMFDTSTLSIQNKCFVCYAFSLDKDVGVIIIPEFVASLNAPYYAVDSSDRCAPGGQGGFCMTSCDKSSKLPRETSSNNCKEGLKCCISQDLQEDCINKGGRCEPEEGYIPYNQWKCKSGNCYIKKEKFASYLDYVQGTSGVSGGAGFIAYEDKLGNGLISNKYYGITLISPGNSLGWDTAAWGSATLLFGAGTVASAVYVPLFLKKTATEAAAFGTYATFRLTEKSGNLAGYNFIYISEYDNIKQKCAVEYGVGGK